MTGRIEMPALPDGVRVVNLLPLPGGAQFHCLVRIPPGVVRLAGYHWHALPTGERDEDGYELWQMHHDDDPGADA